MDPRSNARAVSASVQSVAVEVSATRESERQYCKHLQSFHSAHSCNGGALADGDDAGSATPDRHRRPSVWGSTRPCVRSLPAGRRRSHRIELMRCAQQPAQACARFHEQLRYATTSTEVRRRVSRQSRRELPTGIGCKPETTAPGFDRYTRAQPGGRETEALRGTRLRRRRCRASGERIGLRNRLRRTDEPKPGRRPVATRQACAKLFQRNPWWLLCPLRHAARR